MGDLKQNKTKFQNPNHCSKINLDVDLDLPDSFSNFSDSPKSVKKEGSFELYEAMPGILSKRMKSKVNDKDSPIKEKPKEWTVFND